MNLRGLMLQGWSSVAAWMTFGLLLEGLLGYRVPSYLDDPLRRELLRLAHAHGALLGLVLVAAALSLKNATSQPSPTALASLRLGAVLMPLGFVLGGAWHYEGDPGPLIWLAPLGGLAAIFGIVSLVLALWKGRAFAG